MNQLIEQLQSLAKAMEGGQQGGAPGYQVQGSALAVEDLSPVIQNVCWGSEHIKLQKLLSKKSCKSTMYQFDRQLDYGQFGGSAQLEGAVGQEEVSSIVRVHVPMCYYSHLRRTTLVANMVETVDGKKAEDRAAEDAAKKIAGDSEFDIFRGCSDFSNAGVFDGNPLALGEMPNMQSTELQIRMSDAQMTTKDLMMQEYGGNGSVIIAGGGVLTQAMVEDAYTRSLMNSGEAKNLYVDPLVKSAYNKALIATSGAAPQRIVLSGSAQTVSGADLARQFVSEGEVKIETSRFLSGKTTWGRTRSTAPGAPSISAGGTTDYSSTVAGSLAAGTYRYIVTACNAAGESAPFGLGGDTAGIHKITLGAGSGSVRIAINAPSVGVAKWFNVYRTAVGGSTLAASYRFIGRVAATSAGAGVFIDLGNKLPGFVTGQMIQTDTMEIRELSPFAKKRLAETDLSSVDAFFNFHALCLLQPRKNVLIDSLQGSL